MSGLASTKSRAAEIAVRVEEGLRRLEAAARMDAGRLARSYAPGKWTARQVLIHLAQAELMIQPRVRLALTATDYVVQPFEQDDLVALEPSVDARTALATYRALRQFALPLFESLTPGQLAVTCRHPHMGALDVKWFLVMLAGHELRHLAQLEAMGSQAAG